MRYYLFAFLLLPGFFQAQSPVTHSSGMGDNVPSLACLACVGTEWNNVWNIQAADDSVATTMVYPAGNCFMSLCSYSRYLYASHFNFAIPADAVIDSILVDIKRSAHDQNTLMDSTVRLEKMGMLTGNNLKSPDFWPITSAYQSYGHDDPLWGIDWLPSDLNDTATGVVLKVMNLTSSNAKADVDHIQMTVYYNTSTGVYSVISSPSLVEWINSQGLLDVNIFTPTAVDCNSKIFNTTGQEVLSVNHGRSLQGENHFHLSTGQLSNGIYIVVMNAGGKIFTKKIIILE